MPSSPKTGPSPPNRDLSEVALRTFTNIAREWGLSAAEQIAILGGREPHSSAALDDDGLTRVSLVIGIYKDINTLLPVRDRANAWMRAENAAFGGSSALDIMVTEGLFGMTWVRRYLAAETN